MSRPRAGHGWTAICVGKKNVWLIANALGQWITSGEAKGWPRCTRCRRPFDPREGLPEYPTACNTCAFYALLPNVQFWKMEGHPFFPYTIGKRATKNLDQLHRILEAAERGTGWRRVLRSFVVPSPHDTR